MMTGRDVAGRVPSTSHSPGSTRTQRQKILFQSLEVLVPSLHPDLHNLLRDDRDVPLSRPDPNLGWKRKDRSN